MGKSKVNETSKLDSQSIRNLILEHAEELALSKEEIANASDEEVFRIMQLMLGKLKTINPDTQTGTPPISSPSKMDYSSSPNAMSDPLKAGTPQRMATGGEVDPSLEPPMDSNTPPPEPSSDQMPSPEGALSPPEGGENPASNQDIQMIRQTLMKHAAEIGLTPEQIEQMTDEQILAIWEKIKQGAQEEQGLNPEGEGQDTSLQAGNPDGAGLPPQAAMGMDPSMGGAAPMDMGSQGMPPQEMPMAKYGMVMGYRPRFDYGGAIDPRTQAMQRSYIMPQNPNIEIENNNRVWDKAIADAEKDPRLIGLDFLGSVAGSAGNMAMSGIGSGISKGSSSVPKVDTPAMPNSKPLALDTTGTPQAAPLTTNSASTSNAINWGNYTYATGGEVDPSMNGIPIEAEGGEVIQRPNGELEDIEGPSHEQGGVPLNAKEGSKVYSARLKEQGETLAKRKKQREARLRRAEEYLENHPTDPIGRKTLKRILQLNEKEEEKDMALQKLLQELTGNNVDISIDISSSPETPEKMAFGGQPGIQYPKRVSYFGGASNPMNDHSFESRVRPYEGRLRLYDFIHGTDTTGSGFKTQLERERYLTQKGIHDTAKEVGIDLGDIPNPKTGYSPFRAGLRKVNDYLSKHGDRIAGSISSGLGDFLAIANQYSTDKRLDDNLAEYERQVKPNINPHENFGLNALAELQNNRDYIGRHLAMEQEELRRKDNANKQRLRESASSVNTLRALDLASEQNYQQGLNQAYARADEEQGKLSQIIADYHNRRDDKVMTGEEHRDANDRAELANRYSQRASRIANSGAIRDRIAAEINQMQQNFAAQNLMDNYSNRGIRVGLGTGNTYVDKSAAQTGFVFEDSPYNNFLRYTESGVGASGESNRESFTAKGEKSNMSGITESSITNEPYQNHSAVLDGRKISTSQAHFLRVIANEVRNNVKGNTPISKVSVNNMKAEIKRQLGTLQGTIPGFDITAKEVDSMDPGQIDYLYRSLFDVSLIQG